MALYKDTLMLSTKSMDSSIKKVLGIFKIALRLRESAYFYVTITGNSEHFQYYNFEINFLENENLFKKTVVSFFS